MKKKIAVVVFLICMCICSGFVCPTKTMAAHQPVSDTYLLVNYLNQSVGMVYKSKACQMFVRQSLENCLGVYNTKISCCATKAWQNYGISSNRQNIPLGATVYFGGSKVTDSYCGQNAGHVGLYVGDGYIVHAWDGVIVRTTIEFVTEKGYTYYGWGWQAECPLAIAIPPEKPVVNMVKSDGGYTTISWNSVDDATGYRCEIRKAEVGFPLVCETVVTNGTDCVVSLPEGGTYYAIVYAYDGEISSGAEWYAFGTVESPKINSIKQYETQIDVEWNNSVYGEYYECILEKNENGTITPCGKIQTNETSCSFELPESGDYTVRVYAYGIYGCNRSEISFSLM